MKIRFETEVGSSLETVKAGFDQSLFLQLKPPFLSLHLDRFDGCLTGHEVHLRTGLPGLLQAWISVITEDELKADHWYFVDEGRMLPYPLKHWRHQHKVSRTAAGGSVIVDDITYSSGTALLDALLYPSLWWVFSGRGAVYRKVFGCPHSSMN
jgi:ligand-binding SRPBCC domain-containing protein